MFFIHAEKEANWLLHLYCVKQMIPYFFAAAHWNYAKYSTWYLSEDMFLRGEHVCRHEEGPWNAVFSEQFGEQTYIQYGKAKGGLVGITLSPDQVARWILSYCVCNTVFLSMDTMFKDEDSISVEGKESKKRHN